MKNLTLLFVFLVALTAVSFGQTNASANASTEATVVVPGGTYKPVYGKQTYTYTVGGKKKVQKPGTYTGTRNVITGVEVPDREVKVTIDQSLAIKVRQDLDGLTNTVENQGNDIADLYGQIKGVDNKVNQLGVVVLNQQKQIDYQAKWNADQDIGIGRANATAEEALARANQAQKTANTAKTLGVINLIGNVVNGAMNVVNYRRSGQQQQVVQNNNNNNRNGNWNRGGWNRGGSNNNGNNNQGCGPGTNYNCPVGPNNPTCTPTQFNNWCGNGNNNNNNNNNTGGPRRVYNCPVGTNCSYPVNTGTTPTYTGGGTNVNNNYNNPIGYTNGGSSNNGNVFNNPNNNTGSSSGGNAPTRIIY
jgi:hypothetical protein